ncbi:PRAG1 kinase, partial [Heliornis fulica]|nr:PRAG1 kinase [Heliornis fulica]
EPQPPPLPKKHLQRAESLPEQGSSQYCRRDPRPWAGSILYSIPLSCPQHKEGAPSSTPPSDRPSWSPKKPLFKSQSLGEPVAPSSLQKTPSPSPAELTFGTADGELGQLLQSPAGVCRMVLDCQAASLARLSARIQDMLMGPEERQQLLQAELAGKSWAALRVLERGPCCESGDAWYYRVGFAFEQTQLVFAAKVPKTCCASLGVQSSLGTHCSIQRLIARFTDLLPQELVLPGSPGEQNQSPSREELAHLDTHPTMQVFISPDVPYQTLADFMKGSHGLHMTSPGHYERLACLLLLQVCMGLEHLQVQNTGQGDLCPKNLLLVQCSCPPGNQQGQEASLGLSLPRLLISSFFKVKDKQRPYSTSQEQDWTTGLAALPSSVADELPEIPSLSIYSTGLKRLAMLLLHKDPCKRVSIERARSMLQVLLWGPRQELFARSKKTLSLLQSWVEMKRALLLLKFAENSSGAVGSPGLEEWLCCQYFQEVTEHTLYQTTQVIY